MEMYAEYTPRPGTATAFFNSLQLLLVMNRHTPVPFSPTQNGETAVSIQHAKVFFFVFRCRSNGGVEAVNHAVDALKMHLL